MQVRAFERYIPLKVLLIEKKRELIDIMLVASLLKESRILYN